MRGTRLLAAVMLASLAAAPVAHARAAAARSGSLGHVPVRLASAAVSAVATEPPSEGTTKPAEAAQPGTQTTGAQQPDPGGSASVFATFTPYPSPPLPPPDGLDEATRKALELEAHIADLQGEQVALEQRLGVTTHQIQIQAVEVEATKRSLVEARRAFDLRVVQLYKVGAYDPLLLVLGSGTFDDFLSRLTLFGRIAAEDDRIISQANLRSAQAEFEAMVLSDLREQDVHMRSVLRERIDELERALAEQRGIESRLSARSRRLLLDRRVVGRRTRAEWRASSIPLGTVIPFVGAVVEPYYDIGYLVAQGQPTRYRTTGERFTAVCSWYGPGFNGKPTASGQLYNQDDLTCASRTLPFGTRLALTRGNRRVIVVVTDRGPYVSGRDLDLSAGAADALGFSGVARIEAEYVVPAG